MSSVRILAVVVTHNRRDLLRRCLDNLLAQRGVSPAILVIDNASNDGTAEMLLSIGVDFITQENLGSAGGWHRGIEEALAGSYEAVWLMDDDGYPDTSALAVLAQSLRPGVACASSVVLREDSRDHFVFPFPRLDRSGLPRLFKWPRKVKTLPALRNLADGGTYPFAHLFNGALISIDTIRSIGNVNRDFFIFGDEVDYFFRLRSAGKVVSVLEARHYHPDVTKRPYTPAKIYYYVKNTLILNRRYFNLVWLRDVLTVAAAIGRTMRRNGFWVGVSLVFGRNAAVLASALRRGMAGKLGKDFDG